MGTNYAQLSIEERCRIAGLQEQGCSLREIAADLDRAPSTIAREINRNAGRQVGYRPGYASQQAKARRWKGSKLERETPSRPEPPSHKGPSKPEIAKAPDTGKPTS